MGRYRFQLTWQWVLALLLPVLKWPGNLFKDKYPLLYWSLLNLSVSTIDHSYQTYSFETFYRSVYKIHFRTYFCYRNAFNQGLLWVLFIILLWLERLFVCSRRSSQMLGLIIPCNRRIQMFNRHSVNYSFADHFLRACFVPGTVVVIRDALASFKRANQLYFLES